MIAPKTAKLMRKFKFDGDVWAMPEATLFFPDEPVVRLTGPIWQINLFTFFLMEALSSNTIAFSKVVRSFLAANGKVDIFTASTTRAHSNESALKFGRAAYFLGAPSNLVPAFSRKFDLPMTHVNTKAYHAFIKSFPSEIQAMRAATSIFPNIGLMIDTYDFKQGVKNAITVAKEVQQSKGTTISGIIIDSGKDVKDYARQAVYVRRALNVAGLKQVKITVAGNFEENKIAELVKLKAPVDGVLACTDLVTSSDSPKLEAVLKLTEFVRDGETHYSAKLTPGKESYPGKKQVFRKFKNGKLAGDVVGLENEKLGKPLLQKYLSNGKQVKKLPRLDEIKKYTSKQLDTLPNNLKRVDKEFKYKVLMSKKLQKLFEESKKQHLSHIAK